MLGPLFKRAIELGHVLQSEVSPLEAQRDQLRSLLHKARATSFGIYYGFDRLLASQKPIEAFQDAVPLHDYDRLNERWWRQQRRMPDITWPGQPQYYALSSGTTGKESKRIPVTEDMLESIRSVSLAQIRSLANFDLPADLFEKEILALSSSTDLKERNGHMEGEISGINAFNAPAWFDYFYKPGREIAAIDNWDDRVAAIVQKAPEWDIGALAGIPSWVLLMLQEVVEHHQLDSIHDLWPNLKIYTTGGVAFEPFRKSFDQLMKHPVHYMDTYLASEGYFAFNARPETNAMQLALSNGIFFEFVPFDGSGFDEDGNLRADAQVKTIGQVEPDRDYALLISTCAGAWRYLIGDTVRFTDVERAEVVITGRTKYFLNVVGSQLSEEKMNRAVRELSGQLGPAINEFAVAAVTDENEDYYHQWILGCEEKLDEKAAARKLDEILKDINKGYHMARKKALKDIRVVALPPRVIYEWIESEKKKGGQVKIPKVMSAEKMAALLDFAKRGTEGNKKKREMEY